MGLGMPSSPKPLRIGIVGLGVIARRAHLPGFANAKGCVLAAAATRRPDSARALAREFGIPALYADWRRLVTSEAVDAVAVCTPNATHAPIALVALAAGKHVLVEKPIAPSREEARRMVKAAERRGRVLMVHQSMRFDPAVRAAHRLFRKGVVGRVTAFRGSLTHRGPAAWSPKSRWFFDLRLSGGGVFLDLGVHVFDTLRYLLGCRVAEVIAAVPEEPGGAEGPSAAGRRTRHPTRNLETHGLCLLKMADGSAGTLHVSWNDSSYQNRYYFFGTEGTLYLNLGKGDPVAVESRRREGKFYPSLEPRDFRPSAFQHFVDCALHGKRPWVDGREGWENLEVSLAAYASLRQRRPVRVRSVPPGRVPA